MTKTYLGSCHCGAERFEIDMDFAATGSSKCNCTYCWKQRNWNAAGMKPDAFRLIAGEDVLGDYSRSGEGFETHHRFCIKCGTATHGNGHIDAMGDPYVGVRVAALDDLPTDELMAAPIAFCDGLNDNWWNAPADIRHL